MPRWGAERRVAHLQWEQRWLITPGLSQHFEIWSNLMPDSGDLLKNPVPSFQLEVLN